MCHYLSWFDSMVLLHTYARIADKPSNIGCCEVIAMRDVETKVTKIEGGTAVINGQTVPIKRHCIFDSGPQGTAHIYVMQETGTEEERLKNRAAIDNALRAMMDCVIRKRAMRELQKDPV